MGNRNIYALKSLIAIDLKVVSILNSSHYLTVGCGSKTKMALKSIRIRFVFFLSVVKNILMKDQIKPDRLTIFINTSAATIRSMPIPFHVGIIYLCS